MQAGYHLVQVLFQTHLQCYSRNITFVIPHIHHCYTHLYPSLKESHSHFPIAVLWLFYSLQSSEFLPSRGYFEEIFSYRANYKQILSRNTKTCIRSDVCMCVCVSKKPHNLQQTTACNTSSQPRLAGEEALLYNKQYLFDTVFSVAVKRNERL